MSLAKVLTSQHLFSYFTGKFFSDEVKMFRRDAVRVELKLHLRARVGTQRVTRWLFVFTGDILTREYRRGSGGR